MRIDLAVAVRSQGKHTLYRKRQTLRLIDGNLGL